MTDPMSPIDDMERAAGIDVVECGFDSGYGPIRTVNDTRYRVRRVKLAGPEWERWELLCLTDTGSANVVNSVWMRSGLSYEDAERRLLK